MAYNRNLLLYSSGGYRGESVPCLFQLPVAAGVHWFVYSITHLCSNFKWPSPMCHLYFVSYKNTLGSTLIQDDVIFFSWPYYNCREPCSKGSSILRLQMDVCFVGTLLNSALISVLYVFYLGINDSSL